MQKVTAVLQSLILLSSITSAQVITETFGTGSNSFSIDFVTVGNPGNAAATGFAGNGPGPLYATTPYTAGSVNYVYHLGKFEISVEMIEKANIEGGLGLPSFASRAFSQPVPATWNQAARFVNWLNTSRGHQAAYNFTSSGSNSNISLWNEGQYQGNNKFRHKDALFVLPSLDEWYKGAFGSPDGIWYEYPNGKNTPPLPVSSGTDSDSAVWNQNWFSSPADIYFAGGLSPYGTMGQGGNVHEFIESAFDGINDDTGESREMRGGSYLNGSYTLGASFRFSESPEVGAANYGFRVAMVPEPSALSLLAVGLGGLAMMRRRRS